MAHFVQNASRAAFSRAHIRPHSRVSADVSALQPCRPGLMVFGVRQRAFGRSAQIVFQTIERSLDGEDVLTLVGEQRQTPG